MTHPPLLRAEKLRIEKAGLAILGPVSFSIGNGETLTLGGPSGCGKTSLLRVLCGLDNPADGTVHLDGKTIDEWGAPDFRRQAIYVSQRPAPLDRSVFENYRKSFSYAANTLPFPEEKARLLHKRFYLEPQRIEQNARSLSEGQQQRVALIRALLLEPRILLLDEPTSGLDDEATARVEEVIRECCAEFGTAAIIVTHDPMQASRWGDRHIDLRDYALAPPAETPEPAHVR